MKSEGSVPLNVELWEYSLLNPEKILDANYFVDIDRLVIPSDAQLHGFIKQKDSPQMSPAELEKHVLQSIDLIASSMLKSEDEKTYDQLLSKLKDLMSHPYANLTTFRSFWPVLDMSHSVYSKLEESQQMEFLNVAVREFIDKRHLVYKRHGYSIATLQVLSDVNAHKAQGTTASHKLARVFKSHNLTQAKSPSELIDNELTFGLMEEGISLADLDPMCKKIGIEFKWHEKNQNKKPDFFLHLNADEMYFGEAKHKKEQGGGQNDQVKEIIKFIKYSESRENFGYISFLDGIYFNSLIPDVTSVKRRLNKGQTQSKEIRKALLFNSRNYFLNTEGLHQFLRIKLEQS
jgi:hypothetical protein